MRTIRWALLPHSQHIDRVRRDEKSQDVYAHTITLVVYSAAIYLARANLNPVLYEGFLANGVAAGGESFKRKSQGRFRAIRIKSSPRSRQLRLFRWSLRCAVRRRDSATKTAVCEMSS